MAKKKRSWYVEPEMAQEIEDTSLANHLGNESELIRELIKLGFKVYKRKKKSI